jgi:hypothetical protein
MKQSHPRYNPDHVRRSCQPILDRHMEDDRKNALARKAEEAERVANENQRQAEERERYKAACEGAIKLAMELEREVDETKGWQRLGN